MKITAPGELSPPNLPLSCLPPPPPDEYEFGFPLCPYPDILKKLLKFPPVPFNPALPPPADADVPPPPPPPPYLY